MKYLGMSVSCHKISKTQLSYVCEKTGKRLGTWQCEYLSSGGESTLIDSCLFSIPMYTMGGTSYMKGISSVWILYNLNFSGKEQAKKEVSYD